MEKVTSALQDKRVTSDIRGFTRADGLRAAVFRNSLGALTESRGTPLGSDTALGGKAGGSPWGFKRTDNVNSYVYIETPNRHIHEITKSGSTFVDVDFTTQFGINAPTAVAQPGSGPLPDVIGYVRSDGKNALVYRSNDIGRVNHIIEITSNFGGSPPWLVSDLTQVSSGPDATTGSAFPYVRSDGMNAIVYIASDNHIHEITSNSPAPVDSDLFVASGESGVPSTDPWGYQRADGINAVVYVKGTQLRELSLHVGTLCHTGLPWCVDTIPAASSASGGLFNRPSGYVRADNISAVVYLTSAGTLNEVSLPVGGTWSDGVLPIGSNGPPIGQPFGFRSPPQSPTFSNVLFRTSNANFVHANELRLANGGPQWLLNVFE